MTKWLLTPASIGTAWQVVRFCGPNGSESRGIVDLTAIRKGHRMPSEPLKRGDLFEIVLIQVKGGDAAWTDADDVVRLRLVAKKHRARSVVLAERKKGSPLRLHRLKSPGRSSNRIGDWREEIANPKEFFR
jgi:hypothetical protein